VRPRPPASTRGPSPLCSELCLLDLGSVRPCSLGASPPEATTSLLAARAPRRAGLPVAVLGYLLYRASCRACWSAVRRVGQAQRYPRAHGTLDMDAGAPLQLLRVRPEPYRTGHGQVVPPAPRPTANQSERGTLHSSLHKVSTRHSSGAHHRAAIPLAFSLFHSLALALALSLSSSTWATRPFCPASPLHPL
jgi:hypothetical protein